MDAATFVATVLVGVEEFVNGEVTAEEFLGAVTLGVLIANGITTIEELFAKAGASIPA